MTGRARRNDSAAFEAEAPLAAIKGETTLTELAPLSDGRPNQIATGRSPDWVEPSEYRVEITAQSPRLP
jgi:hypothetical protein